MKTIVVSSPIITSDNIESSIMGMDAAGMNTATYFMRDKIYSDKVLAVVREYACNAIDEHQKYKISKPVSIGLRDNGDSKEFFVRDFAKGLSEQGVRNIFGMYFRSTKSKSNDSIGGFGVGSKAGHCYTDTFFVTSHFQGIKSTYTCMLGGGESGVPVGHIYKVDECPTKETGIEISLVINKEDIEDFDSKIENFVSLSPFNIEYFRQINGTCSIKKPCETVYRNKIGDFDVRLVKAPRVISFNKIVIQMGGVSYEKVNYHKTLGVVKKDHVLIVDVPIGTMSIPLSRESFEDTKSNIKIFEKIEKMIKDLSEQDLSKFKNKTVLDLMKDASSASTNLHFTGDIFEVKAWTLYSREWSLANSIRQVIDNETVHIEAEKGQKEQKPVLIVLPNSTVYWSEKLKSYCQDNKINFYKVSCDNAAYLQYEELCKDVFTVKSVKRLKFPVVPKKDQKYSVWGRYNKKGMFNAETLNQLMLDNLKITVPDSVVTVEDYYKFNKERISKISTIKELNLSTFSFLNFKSSVHGRNGIDIFISSKILKEALLKFGWIFVDSPEYISLSKEINKAEEIKLQAQRKIREAKKHWIIYDEKTLQKIESNVNFASKIEEFWKKILNENSIRGKIFTAISHSYASPKLERSEIRKILNLK